LASIEAIRFHALGKGVGLAGARTRAAREVFGTMLHVTAFEGRDAREVAVHAGVTIRDGLALARRRHALVERALLTDTR
jgi:hypothetical protein